MDTVELTLKNMKTFYLVSCITNGIVFLLLTIWVVLVGAATCGIGCLFIVFPLINLTGMILDILAMRQLGQPPSSSVYSFLRFVSIFDILCWALVPVIMGILNLLNLAKPEVHAHFHGRQSAS